MCLFYQQVPLCAGVILHAFMCTPIGILLLDGNFDKGCLRLPLRRARQAWRLPGYLGVGCRKCRQELQPVGMQQMVIARYRLSAKPGRTRPGTESIDCLHGF